MSLTGSVALAGDQHLTLPRVVISQRVLNGAS